MSRHRTELESLWGDADSSVEYDPEFSPEIEKPPAKKSGREIDRVLSILDEIQTERLRKQNFEHRGAE